MYKNTFVFDAMGNRTSAMRVQGTNTTTTTGVPNALNQLTSLSTSVNSASAQTSALSYDGGGYDGGGNLTQSTSSSGAQTLYTYDDLERLTRIENKNEAGAFTNKSEFGYDYASRKAVSAHKTRCQYVRIKVK